MAESLNPDRLDSLDNPGVERDAKTEDLLLTGLDRYFAGEYQQAINVWTRVLFLDRGHDRARAYIERARSALAEQQRESEELLDSGVEAFNRGDIGLARHLLTSSLDSGGPQEIVLPILARLNRLEAAVTAVEAATDRAAAPAAVPAAREAPRRAKLFVWLAVALLLVAAAAFVMVRAPAGFAGIVLPSIGAPAEAGPVTPPPADLVPIARPGEIALSRAEAFAAAGRPYDALRALGTIRPTDSVRPEADRLRAEIQRGLLSSLPAGPDAAAPGPGAGPAGPAGE